MPIIVWDARGLAKRDTEEDGAQTVDALFTLVRAADMVGTPWTYAETFSILLRRLNDRTLDQATFLNAVALLQAEVVADPNFRLLSITDAPVFHSLSLMRTHNLNATDAAILATYLNFQRSRPAGAAEGLSGLNPQLTPVGDLPASLAGP